MAADENLSASEETKNSSVHLRGDLSKPPSRALWLIKWLIALPHYVILAFLILALIFVTIFVFFAIVFTGKYPRKSFDFVVGVLRWGWRVKFYAFNVLGTDKYPPFSLKPKDDYPADLHIDYSERLSQWLPLVKWFLAIPHYLVLIVFIGNSTNANVPDTGNFGLFRNSYSFIEEYSPRDGFVENSQNYLSPKVLTGDFDWKYNNEFPGLRTVLIIIALIALLFTGRYHKDIFRLVMGINRWIYRVNAYLLFLTDEYPKFRLMD